MDKELIDALTNRHIDLDDPNIAEVFAQREPTQVADLKEEAASELNKIALSAGYRARMVAPLLRGEDIVGMLVSPPHAWRVCQEHRRYNQDICSAIGSRRPERAAVPRDRGEEPGIG